MYRRIDWYRLYRWMQHVARVRSNCWHLERDMMWWQAVTSCDKLWLLQTAYKLRKHSCTVPIVPLKLAERSTTSLRPKGKPHVPRVAMLAKVPRCAKMCQDVPRCAKMCQDVPRCAKMCQGKRHQTSNEFKWDVSYDVSWCFKFRKMWWFCVLDLQRVASIHWMW